MGLFDLDLLTILTAYLLFSFGHTGAGAFALGQGFLIDVFSGGLHGLFACLGLIVWGWICMGSRLFNLQEAKGQIIIVSSAVFLKNIIFLLVLSIFNHNIILSMNFLLVSAASIAGSGLITPIIFRLLNRLGALFAIEDGDSSGEKL